MREEVQIQSSLRVTVDVPALVTSVATGLC
jgi:hypothetical protein